MVHPLIEQMYIPTVRGSHAANADVTASDGAAGGAVTFVGRLRAARAAAGLSQAWLAERMMELSLPDTLEANGRT